MKRIILALTVAAMMAAIAAPAKADVVDDDFDGVLGDDTVLLVDDGSSSFDDLCSPLIDGIDIPGCIFSDGNDFDVDNGFVAVNGFVSNFDDDDFDIDFDDGDFDVDLGSDTRNVGNGNHGVQNGNSKHVGGGGKSHNGGGGHGKK